MFDGLNSHFSKNLILCARIWILRLTSLVSTVAGVRFVTTCSLEGGYQHWEETCWPSRRGWSAEAWRWRHYTLPKCLCPPSRLYNVTTQTTRHLTFLRTINLFLNNKFWCLFILQYSCFVIIKIPYEDIKRKETTLLWKWYSGFLEAYVLNAASLYIFAFAIDLYSMTTRSITWKIRKQYLSQRLGIYFNVEWNILHECTGCMWTLLLTFIHPFLYIYFIFKEILNTITK